MPNGNTQIVINYGAAPNDGTGDPLRTAFIKTDNNFSNIWLAGPVGSNVRIANNTISTINTNGNLTISPNGIGSIYVANHVRPTVSDVYDLGDSSHSYRSAYIGTGGINTTGNLSVSGLSKVGVYTAANLTAITGTVGQIAAVSNSPTAGGRIAFWDTTNSRWSYISDNAAV